MPLPPALAAKLSKRGIIAPKQKPAEPVKKKIDFKGFSTCPNKSNLYHDCNNWCETHWRGVATPEPKYFRNLQKLLAKYPLPPNWTEIFDKGIGRYYYWNVENDMVTWLPPKHPKATITKSAAKLRERSHMEKIDEKVRDREDISKRSKDDDRNSDRERDRDKESGDDDRSYRSKHSDRRERDRDRDDRRNKRDKGDRYRRDKRAKKEEALDPMDPAAYSDIPKGTWSDGLETNKQRADNTASGVLFQQRPYPAPGAVLAANKEKEEKDKKRQSFD